MRRVCKILAWGFLLAVAGVGLCTNWYPNGADNGLVAYEIFEPS